MALHRPTSTIGVDCFPEETIEAVVDGERDLPTDPMTPEEVAQDAWEQMMAWLENGYLPIVHVEMPDGSSHDVDLDMVRKSVSDGTQ